MSTVRDVRRGERDLFDPRHLPLFESELWGVLLHRNQWNLGRSLAYLRTRALDDPLELTPDEREELWAEVLPRLATALFGAFSPDRLNYIHLSNRKQHVHWHVVPRYEREPVRVFGGHTFTDKRRGRTPRLKKKGNVSAELLEQIAAEVRAHLP
jgi:diadenosine tetraphosphate (Ap4A) HIT family hydrolase